MTRAVDTEEALAAVQQDGTSLQYVGQEFYRQIENSF